MLIDKIAYKHPYSQRQHHVEIIKIYIDDKAAHRPDNQYQETTAQDSQKPVEIDVLLIRKPLLQLAMIAPDEEEHHDESGKTINCSPHRKDVEIDTVARHAVNVQAQCIYYQHQDHDEAKEPVTVTALAPEHPCHHGKNIMLMP